MTCEVQLGDFTQLAQHYGHRPGYSQPLLHKLLKLTDLSPERLCVADVGAGTGKLTAQLSKLKVGSLRAVEPNDAMREEGQKFTQGLNVTWSSGSGESTGLPDASVDWLLMGSSFHWVKTAEGLAEFHRVLKPGGMFTALWNPRDLERSQWQTNIENKIKQLVPGLRRVSSGGRSAQDWLVLLASTGHFKDVIFMEMQHEEVMSKERYMGIWKSVNDIQVQAGPEVWSRILNMIEEEISGMSEIRALYTTRAWTAWRS